MLGHQGWSVPRARGGGPIAKIISYIICITTFSAPLLLPVRRTTTTPMAQPTVRDTPPPPQRPPAYVFAFDIDDTLCNTTRAFYGGGARERRALDALHARARQAAAHARGGALRAFYQRAYPSDPSLASAVSALRGHKLAFTNASRLHGHLALAATGLGGQLAWQIDADHGLPLKPHPAMYRAVERAVVAPLAAARGGGRPTVIFLDDHLPNLRTASEMGWFTVWVHPVPGPLAAPDVPAYVNMHAPTVHEAVARLHRLTTASGGGGGGGGGRSRREWLGC